MAYLASHEKVVIVQPKMPNGSLKDLIYEVSYPIILDWSQKYSNKSSGLSSDKVARYGRQILEVSVCVCVCACVYMCICV